MPIITVGDRYQDVWVAGILATFLGVINAFWLSRLVKVFQGRTITQYLEGIGARFSAKLVGFLFFIFGLHVASITLRDFGELMVTVFFPETPLMVFIIVIALLTAWAVYAGFEVVARIAQFLLPLSIIGILSLNLMSINLIDIQNFFPVIENGASPIIRGGITQWAFFGDVSVWLMLAPHLNRSGGSNIFMPIGVGVSGLMLVIILIFIIGSQVPQLAFLETYPYLSMVQTVAMAGFLERIEGAFMMIWIAANYLKIVVFTYVAVFSMGQFAKLKTHRPLILPMVALAVPLSILLFEDYQQLRVFFRPEIYAPYVSIIQIGIPALVTVLWLVQAKAGKPKETV